MWRYKLYYNYFTLQLRRDEEALYTQNWNSALFLFQSWSIFYSTYDQELLNYFFYIVLTRNY